MFEQLDPKKVGENSRECHNHKPQPFPDPKRKRKPTNLNKHKPNKRTKSTKISSLFPKRGNRNTKRTEKHKNKMTHGKTYNKSPRIINHNATRSKTNTGTTALEPHKAVISIRSNDMSTCQQTGFKFLLKRKKIALTYKQTTDEAVCEIKARNNLVGHLHVLLKSSQGYPLDFQSSVTAQSLV